MQRRSSQVAVQTRQQRFATLDALLVGRQSKTPDTGPAAGSGAPLGLAFHVARETAEQALMGMR